MKKICNVCKENKEIKLFSKGQRECKACRKLRDAEHYQENRAAHRAKVGKRKKESKEMIDSFKVKCENCGVNHPAVLDFHHKDPSTKLFDITSKVGGQPDMIKKEIAKCIVLCSNCHKILHWEERNKKSL